jgi:hypothetical protein
MREQILNDLTAAMRNKDKELLSVIRMIKGAIQLEEINKKRELNDEEIISIIAKQIKTRKESISEFEKGNRTDLIEQTNKEIEIISRYMPEQMGEEEIIKVVEEAFLKMNPTAPTDMGKIMGYVTPILKGKADMGVVSKIIKERLSSL